MRRSYAPIIAVCVAVAPLAAALSGQTKTNPRFGGWKMTQDPPATNIMTYEPWGDGGMKITVEATNAEGRKTKWTYNTLFDGKDMPVSGDTRTEFTAVRKIDDRTNEITNKRRGKGVQGVNNVLSPDRHNIHQHHIKHSDDADEE